MEQKKLINNGKNPFDQKKLIMAEPPSYSPITYLNEVAKGITPKLTFKANTEAEAKKWKEKLRVKLWELIGETHNSDGYKKPSCKQLEKNIKSDYIQEKWLLDIVPGRSMPFYILKPTSLYSTFKTFLCIHGHGNGVSDIINMPKNDTERDLIKVLKYDYAVQCVKKNWCVIAPELFTFGERLDYVEDARPGFDGGCEKPFLNAIQVGKTLIGIRVKDICTLIDWLTFHEEFELNNLSCLGLSGGGALTMYATALDDRIKRALISGYATEALGSIFAIRHCSCNYIPYLYQWADFPDIAGLIAPRFLIIQAGKKDVINPIESARAAFKKIESVYRVYKKSDMVKMHEHAGPHEFWSSSLNELLI